jgi:hypothetical protein
VRENRTHGSEGGEVNSLPYPYQMPWMASAEHILVFWIPAIPAGKTLLLKHLYNQVYF